MKSFIKYFTGLKRNYGYCNVEKGYPDPDTGKIKFDLKDYGWARKPIVDQDYIDHLEGKRSIGINPCDDEGLAIFGAIDIDPKNYIDFKPEKYLKIIETKELPVIPVKSKSGGLHIYVFTKERVKASDIREFLEKLLFVFGLPAKTEIYPKQTSLEATDGRRPSGNFINIPYYNKKDRVAVDTTNTEISFDTFMKAIELNAQTEEGLKNFGAEIINKELKNAAPEFIDGPPCMGIICGMLDKGEYVSPGKEGEHSKMPDERDRYLYNYMVFAKRKYPDSWETKVLEHARKYIHYDTIWGDDKVNKKIKAWKGDTAGYTCYEDPIQAKCAKHVCLRRKFGVGTQLNGAWPDIISVTRLDYKPQPKYFLYVKQPTGKIKTVYAKHVKQIIEQRELKALIADATKIVPPPIKQKDFQAIINDLWAKLDVETPDPESQPAGILFRHIKEYLNDIRATTYASFKSGGVLVEDDKAYFLFHKFYEELKRNEWKYDEAETKTMVKEIFKGKRVQKRFPKAKENAIWCTELEMEKFEEEDPPEELLEFDDREDIV
jgi:hypothetical protein|tara:strand:+ start:607 stop:2247 length:1641 start_codon:yes stop_codon:yes gene_type:complete